MLKKSKIALKILSFVFSALTLSTMSLCSATEPSVTAPTARDEAIEGLRELLSYADEHLPPIFRMTLSEDNTAIYHFEINGVIPPYYIVRNDHEFPNGEVFVADGSEPNQLFRRFGRPEQVYTINWFNGTPTAFVRA